MAMTDTNLSRVRVSATQAGTFTNVGYTRSFDFNEGTEGSSVARYFGGEARKAGDPTVGGSLSVFYDPTDTTGQEILKTAKRGSTTVFLQICPAGTATGAKVEQVECYITELNLASDRDGGSGWVERGITYEGIPDTLTTVTLA